MEMGQSQQSQALLPGPISRERGEVTYPMEMGLGRHEPNSCTEELTSAQQGEKWRTKYGAPSCPTEGHLNLLASSLAPESQVQGKGTLWAVLGRDWHRPNCAAMSAEEGLEQGVGRDPGGEPPLSSFKSAVSLEPYSFKGWGPSATS